MDVEAVSEVDTTQGELDVLRDTAHRAVAKLEFAVWEACPGPHEPQQHHDAKPKWCEVCGRTALGHLVGTDR